MAELATYFSKALTNIEPIDDEANAITAHQAVVDALCASDELKNLGISPVLIGSYKRQVSIKRIKDVDVFGRLDLADSTLLPGAALDTFESVLADKKNFGPDRVEKQNRSIKISFPGYDLTVDAVPARPCGDHWEVPNRPEDAQRAAWVETDPLKFAELTTQTNQQYILGQQGAYVPTVKLVRQVRNAWIGEHPGGFFFEVMTYWAFNNGMSQATSIAEYLTLTLERISAMLPVVKINGLKDATLPDKTITTKASAADFDVAINKIAEAAALARGAFDDDDECSAAIKWRDLLGQTPDASDVFELPSYCNSDGSHKAASAITPGATRVPAGNDRYA